jgi:N-acetyltransferase 10
MLGVGLQHRTMDDIAGELDVPTSQLLALFNKTMRRILAYLNGVLEKAVDVKLWSSNAKNGDTPITPLQQTLREELDEVAKVKKVIISLNEN